MTPRLVVLLSLGASLAAACAPRGARADRAPEALAVDSAAVEDSVRGIVLVVGNEPGYLALRPASGGVIDLLGGDLASLRSANGLEVTLFGQVGPASGVTLATSGFVVTRFAVRAVDGIAAIDGVLERTGDGHALRLADGSAAPLADVPERLRAVPGARIFWAGSLASAPRAYGILALPPH